MRHVLDEGLWLFERNLLLLKEIKAEDIPLQISLNVAEFWVQVHDVAYDFMNLGSARRIDNYIGNFINSHENQFDEKWEAYMRIRVSMDIRRPLKKGTLRKGVLANG
ncbi:unnamed protein product [Cuscuta europaea]|uniref:DUF4283 domain-containing protein n=1 Tax=Cuscuta europaea TaxID=41803 RepID=A0A9P0ZFQ5_CUSEU|nr:unnamed protein product [Cuscuta europaea]